MLAILSAAGKLLPARTRRRIKRIGALERLYDRAVVTRNFHRQFGRKPNLKRPTTFNEKIVCKILYDRRPLLTRIADKVQVRDYVAEKIGAEYLTRLYQTCRSANEIDWESLPERFAIKASHGSHMTRLISNKSQVDRTEIESQADRWLSTNYYDNFREWCYRDIRPALLIEEMLSDNGKVPPDWKFFTFDGRAKYVSVYFDRFVELKKNNYDRQLKRLDLRYIFPNAREDPVFPENIELMFSLAEKLGKGLDFVRVDLYNVNGRVVFSELTNYPQAGLGVFDPPEFDTIFGKEWHCPVHRRHPKARSAQLESH